MILYIEMDKRKLDKLVQLYVLLAMLLYKSDLANRKTKIPQ